MLVMGFKSLPLHLIHRTRTYVSQSAVQQNEPKNTGETGASTLEESRSDSHRGRRPRNSTTHASCGGAGPSEAVADSTWGIGAGADPLFSGKEKKSKILIYHICMCM